MKILILFSHAWRGGRAGGAETHALQLMREFSRRGHEVIFVAATGKTEEPLPPGVTVQYRLPFQTLNPFDKVQSFKQLANIVERHGVDIIHAHHRTGGYFAEGICRRLGVPYLVTVHDIWHRTPFKSFHGRLLRQYIAISEFIKRGMVEKFGITPAQIRVIYNGMDPARFEVNRSEEAKAFREKFGITDEVVFSTVTRVTESKGHFDIIEAVRKLPRELRFRCLIVGEGRIKKRLELLVSKYGLDEKITFCGFQSDVPAVMQASDVILMPSHREPFSMTMLESMFSRKTLLVADSGGTPEAIKDGFNGLVFPTKDADAMARAMVRLVGGGELRKRLAEQAYRSAHERFLLSKTIDETEAYLADVLHSSRVGGSVTAARKNQPV